MDAARDELRQEIENIRAAVDWAVIHWDIEIVRQILSGLLDYYVVQGWHEGSDTFRDVAQARKEALISNYNSGWANDPIYLSALVHQAFLLCNLGQIDESDAISRECLAPLRRLGIKQELSECVHNLGVNASYRGDYQFAMEYLEQAILLGKDNGNIIWYTYLLWLGHTYFLLGEYDYGLESLQKCYALYDQKGILWGMAFALSKMGLAATGLGNFLQAKQYHHQALGIFEKNGNQAGKAYALSRMSMSAYFLGEYSEAVQLAQEGYQIFQMLGHHWGICTSLCVSGFGYIGLGELSRAGACFRNALEQSRKYQMTPLSLYALAGLAAVLIHIEGEENNAMELLHYIQSHPQTPAIYIQQTMIWFKQEHQKLQDYGNAIMDLDDEIEAIKKAVKRMLDERGSIPSPSM
jgi:tetratricopeptide (TPR) repeat protein